MGTEQQQELKSEKPLIKQQRKTIPFTDNSIDNWKPKNQQKMATVYKWHKQASKNTKLTPVVVCKMNTRDPLVVLDLDHFMSLIR